MGLRERPLRAGKSRVRIAHLVLAHKSPEQVIAYARQLSDGGRADVYIHVDAKCPEAAYRAIAAGGHAIILTDRVSVTWGDHSIVEATLLLMRAARASGKDYGHVCLSSGQDLLIRPGVAAYLEANGGKVFMDAERFEPGDSRNAFQKIRWPKATRNLYDFPLHPWRAARVVLIGLYTLGVNILPCRRPLPEGWLLHRGSQWFAVPGDAFRWMLDYLDKNPAYSAAFEDSFVSDMIFFHTLIMNSPYAAKTTGANLTYLRFGPTYLDRSHPVILTMADVPVLDASGRYFARKFEASVDAEVIRHYCGQEGAQI